MTSYDKRSVSKNMRPSSRENSWFTLQKYKDKVKQKEAIKKLHLLFDENTYASYNKPVYTKAQKKQIIFDALEDIDVVGCMTKINTFMQEFKTGHGSRKKKRVNWDRINKLAEPLNRDHELDIIKKERRLQKAGKTRLRQIAKEKEKKKQVQIDQIKKEQWLKDAENKLYREVTEKEKKKNVQLRENFKILSSQEIDQIKKELRLNEAENKLYREVAEKEKKKKIVQIKKEQRLKEIEKNKLRKIAEENEKKDRLKRIQFREYNVRL